MRISLCDGTGNPLMMNGHDSLEDAVKQEASLDGWTSLVVYEDPIKRVTISQFQDETWDVSLNDETVDQYDNSDEAAKQFMQLCRNASGVAIELSSLEDD